MRKEYLFIIFLLIIIISLFYFILIGSFCHCSTIYCPNSQPILRAYFA